MKCFLLVLSVALCGAQDTFNGVLDPELQPSGDAVVRLVPATEDQRRRLLDALWPTETVWAADVRGAFALVVDRVDGKRVLYVDQNNDFELTREELVEGSSVRLGRYPVTVRIEGGLLRQSARALMRGAVEVDGRNLSVAYEVDRVSGLPSPSKGVHLIDGQAALAVGKAPVFAVGDRFVSTSEIDVAKSSIVLRTHPASDYPTIDVAVGRLFHDFTFVDATGVTRKLTDFRGRYVLLDFWASWCPPCRSDFEHLARAYARYRPALEIIGMNGDTEPEQAASLLAEQKPTWTQATAASIRDLLDDRLRLYRYPAYVLLDREGRVLWVLTGEIGGPRLERVLAEFVRR